ncbi:MAG: chemotaxis protein CheW [Spirochaetaceae bacterium]|nr:MAG: chemotaxis protein CheW [Spirochaetaceae bacterium]
MEVKAEYKTIFAEEAKEHLEEWEAALLNLEQNPGDTELVHQMFRAIHTLKGSAGFIGYEKLQRLTHGLESALQAVRDGVMALTPEMVDVLFQGLDLASRMVESFTSGATFEENNEEFLSNLWTMAEVEQSDQIDLDGGGSEECDSTGSTEVEDTPVSARDSSEVGQNGPAPHRYQLELWIKSSGREAYLRAFLVRNRLSEIATILSEEPAPEILRESSGRFVYTLVIETTQDEPSVREALNVDLLEVNSLREVEKQAGVSKSARKPGATPSEMIARAAKAEEVVRVSVERLDTLLNLVGELVIQNSGFVSVAQELKDLYGKSRVVSSLEEKTEGLGKITRDLQDGIMKVRMLPVNNVFRRFYRVVRDLAKDRGKEVTLDIFGEETEIDKKVMDHIGDPLVHLIRNAVDHGIESREQRLKAGKTPIGLIRLGAYQDGDHICIEVSDDGRGMNKEAVLKKAVEKGLVSEAEVDKLSDEQLLSLIFLPGFSTVKEVSEVSGRGVGMDVVKRAIEGMSGNIRIRSMTGRGTTVTVSLPLTMAIIPAVLVEVGGSTLAVPLSSVKEVLKVTELELKTIGGRRVIRLRDEVLTMIHLSEALSLDSNGSAAAGKDTRMPVVIVDYEEKKIGLGVDKVIGTGEIVIKSLSRHYQEIEGLIGASILGNGKISLIVDVEALVRIYYRVDGDERRFTGSSVFTIQGHKERKNPKGVTSQQSLEESKKPSEAEIQEQQEEVAPDPVPAEHEPEAGQSNREEGQPDDSADALAMELNAGKHMLLEEVHNTGAIQASMALSQLTDREIRVSFPESQIVRLAEIAHFLGGEEKQVGGVYVGVDGNLNGGILMVLPVESVLDFHDRLYRRTPGTCTSIEDVDMSGISELGNILAASFLIAISDGTGLRVKSETPEISVDMCQPVIDSVLARFNQPGDRILLTKALIYSDDDEEVVCHLLMFLEPESLRGLIKTLMDNLK